MSKGFGKVETIVLEYLTGYCEKYECFHAPAEGVELYSIVFCVTRPPSDWGKDRWDVPQPTASQYRSVRRAVYSLKSKGILEAKLEPTRPLSARGRHSYLHIKLTDDYLCKIPSHQQDRFKRSLGCISAI